ncbi:MAG: cob(I)yrinic acid a,c-diamide adenosyltransferase [Thermodesulfobacteriota bacterium]
MNQGYVHMYTGDGKGKTTASIGQSVRALGAGFRVYFCQFCKKGDFSELAFLSKASENIRIEQVGNKEFLNQNNFQKQKNLVSEGFEKAYKEIFSLNYDLAVLDEIVFAVYSGLIEEVKVLDLIKSKPYQTELVLTGRGECLQILEAADIVTVMENRRHYFEKNVQARKGIEF